MNRPVVKTEVAPPSIGRPGGPGGGHGARFTPGEKAKDAKGTFRKLLNFYFKEAKSLFIVIALLLAETVINVFIPYIIGKAIDAMDNVGGVDFNLVYKLACIHVVLITGIVVLSISNGVIMNVVSQKIVRTIFENYKVPYMTLTPTYSVCKRHGYIPGKHEFCPKCDAEMATANDDKKPTNQTNKGEKNANSER